ncbi:MAG: ChaB family protein [Candidatus Omnitrophota bacterium]|jgi:cation transport regulator
MPRRKVPGQLRDKLPKKAREIWVKAFNNAFEQYKDPKKRRGKQSLDEVASKTAWNAVKKNYKKGKDGKWHKKKK